MNCAQSDLLHYNSIGVLSAQLNIRLQKQRANIFCVMQLCTVHDKNPGRAEFCFQSDADQLQVESRGLVHVRDCDPVSS